ncbi:hypothetical protein [Streptomyces mirabilis]|uniref:hypothetical protein n=1 Tax=Streptomyces mirabilis TaxID=68239 RepID=UPI0036F186F9
MSFETADEEIERLEAERHSSSETFKNTDPADAVTRAHLQEEMNRRTNRIQELQELQQHQPLGFFARRGLRAAALGPLGAHGRSARGGPSSAAFSSLHSSPSTTPADPTARLTARSGPPRTRPAIPARRVLRVPRPPLSPTKEHPAEPRDLTLTEHQPTEHTPPTTGMPTVSLPVEGLEQIWARFPQAHPGARPRHLPAAPRPGSTPTRRT